MRCAQVFPYRTDPAEAVASVPLAAAAWAAGGAGRQAVSTSARGAGETPGGMRHKRCDRTGLHGRWWEEQYGMCAKTPSGCSSACGRKRPPGHHFAGRVCLAVQELLMYLVPECEEVFFSLASREARGIQGFKF